MPRKKLSTHISNLVEGEYKIIEKNGRLYDIGDVGCGECKGHGYYADGEACDLCEGYQLEI